MYSRNQSRTFEDDEYEDDYMSEEFEFYGYNLPPNYDRSRFQRSKKHVTTPKTRPKIQYTHPPLSESADVSQPEDLHTDKSNIQKLLDYLGERFGYEEMLIISVILILSSESECADTILLLALLLIVN